MKIKINLNEILENIKKTTGKITAFTLIAANLMPLIGYAAPENKLEDDYVLSHELTKDELSEYIIYYEDPNNSITVDGKEETLGVFFLNEDAKHGDERASHALTLVKEAAYYGDLYYSDSSPKEHETDKIISSYHYLIENNPYLDDEQKQLLHIGEESLKVLIPYYTEESLTDVLKRVAYISKQDFKEFFDESTGGMYFNDLNRFDQLDVSSPENRLINIHETICHVQGWIPSLYPHHGGGNLISCFNEGMAKIIESSFYHDGIELGYKNEVELTYLLTSLIGRGAILDSYANRTIDPAVSALSKIVDGDEDIINQLLCSAEAVANSKSEEDINMHRQIFDWSFRDALDKAVEKGIVTRDAFVENENGYLCVDENKKTFFYEGEHAYYTGIKVTHFNSKELSDISESSGIERQYLTRLFVRLNDEVEVSFDKEENNFSFTNPDDKEETTHFDSYELNDAIKFFRKAASEPNSINYGDLTIYKEAANNLNDGETLYATDYDFSFNNNGMTK